MYICLCKAVSEKRIAAAVGEGACTLRDLTRELRVGTVCGKCIPAARETLSGCLSQRDGALPEATPASLPGPLATLERACE